MIAILEHMLAAERMILMSDHIECFPLGNAESVWVTTPQTNRLFIFDYAETKTDDEDDKRANLKQELIDRVGKGGTVPFVSFSHADMDHIQGASGTFYLEYAKKYQDDERIHIETLCVPAHFILESRSSMSEEGKIIQAEARDRLRRGEGIVVISEPDALDEWLKKRDIDPAMRKDCIVTAGNLLPMVNLDIDGMEIFAHSPFSYQSDDGRVDRNTQSSVFHVTVVDGDDYVKALILADVDYEVTGEIVQVTESHGNTDRLESDLIVVVHHGSRGSIKENEDSDVNPSVNKLYREYAREGVYILIPSRSVPDDEDDIQPPHKDAVDYYNEVAHENDGEAIIMMEHPNKTSPKPFRASASGSGQGLVQRKYAQRRAATAVRSSRAGCSH